MAFAGWWLNLDGAQAPAPPVVPSEKVDRVGGYIIQSVNDGNIARHNASILSRQMPSRQFAFLLDKELRIQYGINNVKPPAFIGKPVIDKPNKIAKLPVFIRKITKDNTIVKVKSRESHSRLRFMQSLIKPNFRRKYINEMF